MLIKNYKSHKSLSSFVFQIVFLLLDISCFASDIKLTKQNKQEVVF